MTTKEELCRKFVNNPGDDIYQLVEELVEMRDEACPCVFPSAKKCTRVAVSTVEEPNSFGFCKPHMKTKKGQELGILWNQLLEELGIEESVEDEGNQTEEEHEQSEPGDEPEQSEPESEAEAEAEPESEADAEPEPEAEPEPVKPKRGRPPLKSALVGKQNSAIRKEPIPSRSDTSVPSAPRAPARKPPVPKTPPQKPSPPTPPVASPVTVKKELVKPNIQVKRAPRVKKQPKSEESSAAEGSAKAVYVDNDDEEESPVLPPLQFHLGKFNNYVNDEHKLVLRLRDKTVLGTENKTGGIVRLTPKDVEICKSHNLQYIE